MDAKPILKTLKLRTGVELPYAEQGNRTDIPVVLLHGVSDSWRSFEPVFPYLPESIHALALTQRGHGDASRPATGYRFHDFAGDVAAFMDAIGLEAAVIVGHSMGSSVARRFAVDHPGRVLGLVLVASFATLRNNPGVRELWDSTISKLTDPVDPVFVREFQESTIAQPVPPAFLETVVRESLKLPAYVWRSAFEGFLADDFTAELGKIETPTVLIWGDRDVFCPRSDQDLLTRAISGSRLVVYAGVGHAPHWEQPERFASDLVDFSKNLSDRGATTKR